MLASRFAQCARRMVPATCRQQRNRTPFSTTAHLQSYDDTLKNLIVTPETKVIVQGFTGRQSTFDSEQTIEFGTKIVGGVRPGKEGEHLGRPYFPSVRAAQEQLKPDATLVYVAASGAASAIEDALDAEIPLIVAVAEHIPLHDMLRVQAMLRSQSKCRMVGANSPGMTSVHARCRLGFQPLPFFTPGNVSLVAKSGTMSYEAIASTTRAGLGQSYAIGIGGDDLPGTDFVDALKIFEQDPHTEGIVLIGEVGGYAEEEVASWIKDYRARTSNPKPIVAVIGGLTPVQGRVMGHDGAFQARGEIPATAKMRKLANAGAIISDHPSYVGEEMKRLLGGAQKPNRATAPSQKRSMHTLSRQRPKIQAATPNYPSSPASKRTFYFQATQALDVLSQFDIPVLKNLKHPERTFDLSFQVHRAYYKPGLHIRRRARTMPGDSAVDITEAQLVYPLAGDASQFSSDLHAMLDRFAWNNDAERQNMGSVIEQLAVLYREKEAKYFNITLGAEAGHSLKDTQTFGIVDAELEFDQWAHTISKRHGELHAQRHITPELEVEVEVAKDNIVYLKRPNPSTMIGTLVNGAGLAMNTVDNLDARGLPATNFLDTGGKATAGTVAASFRAVLGDDRVRALFVNIFGGLTRCEVIAEGILQAYRDVGVKVPVVVRLRGTNEALGRETLEKGAQEMGVGRIGEAKTGGMSAVEGFDEAMDVLRKATGAGEGREGGK